MIIWIIITEREWVHAVAVFKKEQTTFITKTWSISCLSIRPLSIEKLQVEGEGNRNRDWIVADSVVTGLVIE